MFLDMTGVDFLRVQSGSGTSKLADILDPSVVFSGAADDGQVLTYSISVTNPGPGLGNNYQIDFGLQPKTPIVFGILRLTQRFAQDNVAYEIGEYLAPCYEKRTVYDVGPVRSYGFTFNVDKRYISIGITGFTGIASFIVLDV